MIPQATLAVEHYNRIYRLLEKGFPVTMELNMDVTYTDDDPMERNVIGEIPGTDTDLKDEVVMLGAHLDSWHAGTGATDNGAGSAVMMEVMRILQAVYAETGKQPRRTIRLALWTGEEQGLLGSRAYVNDHFATTAGRGQPPTELKPEHDAFSAYYNMDNGTGKVRGVYLQGNETVAPIFRAWLKPFNDLGAATLTMSNTGGTDHLSFDGVGLPGFQFIQEPIAYSSRTHHSTLDVLDHAIEDDLKQAATIIASFVYHTAQRDEKLPRKPLPGQTVIEQSGQE
jgi:Zn-dependent M28 family amino/carboxypeptidase